MERVVNTNNVVAIPTFITERLAAKAAQAKTDTKTVVEVVGSDMRYHAGADVFALAGPMMWSKGWSVVPQERQGRWTSRVNDKAVAWKKFQTCLPTMDEMNDFCRDARLSNVAVVMGEASGKVFCVDIDCMDSAVSARVQEIALEHLGHTPFVRVGRAPKTAWFYRYADKSPCISSTKLIEYEKCEVEIKAAGSMMTMYGIHHTTGCYYQWDGANNPVSHGPEDFPIVTVQQAEAFLDAVRAEYVTGRSGMGAGLGYLSSTGTLFDGEVDADGLTVPVVTFDEKKTDSRKVFLRDLTWNLVWRNQDVIKSADDADAMSIRLTDLAQKYFMEGCEMGGEWTPHFLRTQAAVGLHGAMKKMQDGTMGAYTAPKAKKPKLEHEVSQHGEQVATLAALAGKAVIRVVDGEMAATVDAAEASLIAGGAGVYQRGGYIVRMGAAPVATAGGIVSGRQILEMEEHSLAEVLGIHATFLRKDSRKSGDGMAVIEPPMSVVKTLAARKGFWKLPVLAASISAPTLRADGSLLIAEGHDPSTGLLLESGGVVWNIPTAPTREQSLDALGLLKGLVSTFPFVGDADRSVVLSMMLTASIRRSLNAAPLHAVSARAAGSGKTKLADIASVIGSGRPASVIAMGRNEEETEKRIGALLMTGDSVMAIDNVEQALSGDFLCQVLTQPMVRTRVLGKSEVPQLPTCVLVTATGNNLRVEADMCRRVLMCMLDADCERPELRVFDTDPVQTAIRERQALVTACLTVLRGFITAGRPRGSKPLGSFEEWSVLVRDALIWMGEADPVLTMEAVRASDSKRERTEAALTQWVSVLGEGRVTGKDIIAAASVRDGFDFRNPEFREAMISVAGESGAVNSRFLGSWMSKTEGRPVAGMKLVKGTLKNGIQQWSVSRTAPEPTQDAAQSEKTAFQMPKFLGG